MAENDTFQLPRISAGVSGEAAINTLNAPVEATEQALNQLSARISNQNNKSAVIRQYVPIAEGVLPGTLVYYDTETARFAPAIAELLGTPGENGASVESPKARCEGLILAIDSSGVTGTMLCGGYYESASVAQACLGVDAVAGTYYLSPFNAGKAVLDTYGHLRQAILSYYGNGKFNLNVFYLAHDNHFHGSSVLTGMWVTADHFEPDGVTPPEGAAYVYDGSGDLSFDNLGQLTAATTAVFYKGTLQIQGDDFLIEQGYLWYKGSIPPGTGEVVVFNHYPFAYNSPIIRSVESTNDALSVVNRNGLVLLTMSDYVAGTVAKNAMAISAIAGNRILYTPVVTEANQGPGILVTRAADGGVTIAASNLVGCPLDAYSINHNGTNMTSDGTFTYFTFPKSRRSEFVMSMPAKDVSDGTKMKATAWGICAGAGATFDVKMYFVPTPGASSPVPLPSAPSTTTTLSFSGQSGQLTYAETPAVVEFEGDGMLFASVAIQSAPSSDIRLMRAGFKFDIVKSESGDEEEAPPVDTTNAITGTLTSGYTASKYDLVYVVDGRLALCRSNNVASANSCVGMALANASTGDSLEYIITGIVQDPSFSFTPGHPVYVGLDGKLTQADLSQTAAYVQKVGMALTAVAVQIRLETAVITEN